VGQRGFHQVAHAAALGGAGGDDRHLPGARAARRAAQLQHVAQVLGRDGGQRQVGLGHRQHVGNLQDAGLDGLHLVAQARRAGDDARVGQVHDLHFRLPGAHGFDDHAVKAGRIEQVDDAARGRRQPAHMPARGHRTDEDIRVRAMFAHAHTVAQHRAAGDGAGRVHRHHRHLVAPPQQFTQQGMHQGRLAGAPGLPVRPSTCARPRCGASAACSAPARRAPPVPPALMARASTCRCPARMPASSGCAGGTSARSVTPGPARGRSPVPGAAGRRSRRASRPPRRLRRRGRRGCPRVGGGAGQRIQRPLHFGLASGRCA
jgi:hypothetical protein